MSDDWRNVFTDKPLQALIDTALQHNADVLTVRQNIEQASWQMRSAGLCYLPSFAFAPSATWQKAQSQPAVKNYELPLTMQWEMHLSGENKAKKSSALKAFENSRLLMQYSQSVGYLEVLTAQSTYLNALLQTSADQLEAQQAKINLYKALCR
jgi:outer membrane protein TolC